MSPVSSRLRFAPHVWAVVLVALLLGPALLPGYVLSYDMVWVPHLAMRPDFLGLGSALPRAVPSDAVVAVLGEGLPEMLLQKLVLVVPLLAGAVGMLRFVGPALTARLVVVTLAVWNPFVAERLAIGHWTMLVGYGVLPWLVLDGTRVRETGRLPRRLLLLLPLGSLSASAGLVSAAALLVPAADLRHRAGALRTLGVAALVLVANGPWLAAGLAHSGSAELHGATAPFALHAEGSLPAPLAALSLGGIWNALVVPLSRQGPLSWIYLALLLVLAGLGARDWWSSRRGAPPPRLLALWGLGMLVACFTWAAPGAVGWLAAHVPGGGLIRDGARSLALCLPAWAALPSFGAARLAALLGGREAAMRAFMGAACVALPVALLYDAAWGLQGALRPVDYPASWAAARRVVSGRPGDVLLLPFTPYRAPAWNHARPVLDPLGRYLRPDFVMNDALLVDGRWLRADDPRVQRVEQALAAPGPAVCASRLRGVGVRWVAVERDAAGRVPAVAGPVVLRSADLEVRALHGRIGSYGRVGGAPRAVLLVAWVLYGALLLVGSCACLASGVAVVGSRLRRDRS